MNQNEFENWTQKVRGEKGYSREILVNLLQEYQKKSGSLIVKMLLHKRLTEVYLYYGQIQPLIGEDAIQDETLFYDNFCYFQRVVPFSDIDKQLHYLLNPKSVDVNNKSIFSVYDFQFCSTTKFEFKKEEQRSYWYDNYQINPRCRLIFSFRYPSPSISYHEELYTNDSKLPYYPRVRDLVKSKFSIDPESVSISNTLHFALTSLEGYINEIKTIDGKTIINVVNESKSPLILKIFIENNKNLPITLECIVEKSQELELSEQFTKMDLLLLDKDGLALDQRICNLEHKSSKEEINELILNGENVNIEFKREFGTKLSKELKDKRRRTYSELISALANTEGGTILLGVDDNTRIIGITKEELDTTCNFIQNINDNTLSPKVIIDMDHVEIDKKIVGIFRERKSNSIIKNGYDNHFYIRRGSTNRIFESEEITNFRK